MSKYPAGKPSKEPSRKVNVRVKESVFNSAYRPYLTDNTRMQIFFGGSSSGKSYFLAQRCVLDMLQGNRNYLCVRKVARYIRKSIFNEITKAISFFKVAKYFTVNSSDLVITGPNGYQILFVGLDDVEKVKSITPARGVITDVWLEEATEASQDDVKQLTKRLRGMTRVYKRITLSFNPIYQTHWLYNTYFAGKWDDTKMEYKDGQLSILKTTYKDNRFLTADDVYDLEHEPDKYYYSVYTLGNWGVLGAVIFKNWRTEDLSDAEFCDCLYGLDFGYANDPAAVVKVYYDKRHMTLYVVDAKYIHGATNDILAAEVKNIAGNSLVICDSAEPKSIQELRNYGITATPAVKGKDSVNFGIQWLQKLQIVINSRLTDAINEITIYKWQEDKDGNVLPKPVDKDNHILDAIRYACGYEMGWVHNAAQSNVKIPLAGRL